MKLEVKFIKSLRISLVSSSVLTREQLQQANKSSRKNVRSPEDGPTQ